VTPQRQSGILLGEERGQAFDLGVTNILQGSKKNRGSGAADKAAIRRVRETEEKELQYTKSATIYLTLNGDMPELSINQ